MRQDGLTLGGDLELLNAIRPVRSKNYSHRDKIREVSLRSGVENVCEERSVAGKVSLCSAAGPTEGAFYQRM